MSNQRPSFGGEVIPPAPHAGKNNRPRVEAQIDVKTFRHRRADEKSETACGHCRHKNMAPLMTGFILESPRRSRSIATALIPRVRIRLAADVKELRPLLDAWHEPRNPREREKTVILTRPRCARHELRE